MYGCTDVRMYGCMDVWMYGCMDVWMYGWMDGWMDGCVFARAHSQHADLHVRMHLRSLRR